MNGVKSKRNLSGVSKIVSWNVVAFRPSLFRISTRRSPETCIREFLSTCQVFRGRSTVYSLGRIARFKYVRNFPCSATFARFHHHLVPVSLDILFPNLVSFPRCWMIRIGRAIKEEPTTIYVASYRTSKAISLEEKNLCFLSSLVEKPTPLDRMGKRGEGKSGKYSEDSRHLIREKTVSAFIARDL